MGKKSRYLNGISLLLLLTLAACGKIVESILTIGPGLSTPEYAATPVKTYVTPLPEFKPLQFAWFYKPPGKNADLGAVAANFSILILTRNDELERSNLRDMGYTGPILQYLRFEAIMDPSGCATKPFQNQAAHLEGDYCQLAQQHPDWFLKDINGRNIRYDQSQYVFMDPGNPQWQAYYLDKVKGFQSDPGWSGLFLDNVDGSLGRFEDMHTLLANYADDAEYQQVIISFLKSLYINYFAPSGKSLFANIPYLKDANAWFAYLQYLDGAMLESFAADWDRGYLSEQDWLAQLDLVEKTQALGKRVILVTQGSATDHQRMQYGLASFLLVNQGLAYFRYSNDEAYNELWWYPQFEIDLGQPLGPRYAEDGLWRRDFEKGYVRVNPTQHSSEIITD